VGVDDLAHDRQPEPRAGLRPGAGRAPEALEHQRPLGGWDAGAEIGDGQLAAAQGDRDRRAGRAPLRGVVEQVQHGPLEQRGNAVDHARLEIDLDRRAVGQAGTAAGHRGTHHVVEADLDRRLRRVGVLTGQHAQIRHQPGQLVELRGEVVEQCAPLSRDST
jgi:hypothetical protein